MKMHHVLYILVLVLGFTGVVCTYYFGIIPRYEAHQELVAEEQQLRARISELERKFSRTQPAAVVDTWRQQIQPWSQAVSARVSYFDTIKDAERMVVIVPEEEKQFPKFWYEKERRRRMEAFADEVAAADLVLSASISQYEPPVPLGPGWSPTIEEIEGWLEQYEYATSFVRAMIEIKARRVEELVIWPEEPLLSTAEGTIQRERAGYNVHISTEDFAKFLANVHNSPTFMAIDALRVTKLGALSDPDGLLQVEFILNKTRFIPAQTAEGDTLAPQVIRRREAAPVDEAVMRALGKKSAGSFSEAELARMRAAAREADPGFFRGILRWFGL